MPFYVYMLACRDGTLYTGSTTDLAARLAAHQSGRGSRYTRGRRPVRLAYCEELPTVSAARRSEATLKRLPRSRKLALIAAQAERG